MFLYNIGSLLFDLCPYLIKMSTTGLCAWRQALTLSIYHTRLPLFFFKQTVDGFCLSVACIAVCVYQVGLSDPLLALASDTGASM